MRIRRSVVKLGTVHALSLGVVGRGVLPITYIGDDKTMNGIVVVVGGITYVTDHVEVANLLKHAASAYQSGNLAGCRSFKRMAVASESILETAREIDAFTV